MGMHWATTARLSLRVLTLPLLLGQTYLQCMVPDTRRPFRFCCYMMACVIFVGFMTDHRYNCLFCNSYPEMAGSREQRQKQASSHLLVGDNICMNLQTKLTVRHDLEQQVH